MDLQKGYHQVPIGYSHIIKTAVTPYGLDSLRLYFGLKNAAQAFQRMTDHYLFGSLFFPLLR